MVERAARLVWRHSYYRGICLDLRKANRTNRGGTSGRLIGQTEVATKREEKEERKRRSTEKRGAREEREETQVGALRRRNRYQF